MQLIVTLMATLAFGAAPAAASRRPPGFNDAVDGAGRPHDPGSIMRGTNHYRKSLEHNGYKFGRGFERIKPNAGHSLLPHIHDYFNFTGTTDGGFLEMRHNALIRNTTINSDDYLELLTSPGVDFTCSAVGEAPSFAQLPVGAAPYYDAKHKLIRNNVLLTISLPSSLGSPGASTATALEHLRSRLAAATNEHTSFAFGFELMATQASFASGSECAAQVPYSTPYFAIAIAKGLEPSSSSWALVLTPATPMDLFLSMDSTIHFDPDVQRAHAHRRAAGKSLGTDVRTPSRKLFTISSTEGVNWNGQTGSNAAAAQQTVDLLPSLGQGVLQCDNCYAYVRIFLYRRTFF